MVIAGGAYGIDSAAHRGVLAAGGQTIAVLATGLDRRYPAAHTELLDRIGDTGLLVSELHRAPHRRGRGSSHGAG